ncbi:IS200/IS605 family transposase [Nitrosococcus oceani]|uniref:IS200/IS605 family transposase n=1 Tax=Nitrosococcus oceani TaxID=1229 RepID=UPI0012E03717|nr:IS200/IS605 family transposase [Nitrosococcus oceani]
MQRNYRRGRYSVTRLVVHLVFTTKYQRKVFDGEEDHVHLLVEYPPKLSISVLVNNLKSTSSRRVRFLNTHIPRLSKSAALWSRSYFACSAGGATLETLKAYVNGQKTPD